MYVRLFIFHLEIKLIKYNKYNKLISEKLQIVMKVQLIPVLKECK